jgi:hypothetical protein
LNIKRSHLDCTIDPWLLRTVILKKFDFPEVKREPEERRLDGASSLMLRLTLRGLLRPRLGGL